jgi:hypothetical protein
MPHSSTETERTGTTAGYADGRNLGTRPTASADEHTAPSQDRAKNWMGLLSVVAILVPPAAIVLGHLALSAVSRGEANNRAVALTGAALGYVLTAALGLYGALALIFAASAPTFS